MTKGQPLVFQRLVVPRKPSSEVTSPSRNRRAKQVERVIVQISRKTESDVVKQKCIKHQENAT